MLMTRTRAALTGAVALNIPTLYWATQLSAVTVLVAAVTLAVVGAALGGLAAFGFTRPAGRGGAAPAAERPRRQARAAA
jgi:hypothetical protein